MRTVVHRLAVPLALLLSFSAAVAVAPSSPATRPADTITTGWQLLKEGAAEGAIEFPYKHPANPGNTVLRIAVSKYAGPGRGRLGAKNTKTLPVEKGQVYDVTFNGTMDPTPGVGYGVGLVFSLESGDGTLLARTTLPEIGRGGGGRGRGNRGPTTAPASQPNPFRPYLLSLTARESSPAAHLVITPIEPIPVYVDNLAVTPRR